MKNKNKKGFTHILLLTAIVLIGTAGILYFAYNNGQIKFSNGIFQLKNGILTQIQNIVIV